MPNGPTADAVIRLIAKLAPAEFEHALRTLAFEACRRDLYRWRALLELADEAYNAARFARKPPRKTGDTGAATRARPAARASA